MSDAAQGDVDAVGIVGAGFMGSGIAESSARAGKRVWLYEPQQAPLDASKARIEKSISQGVKGGKLSDEQGQEMLARIGWSTDLAALAEAEIVIEAATENPDVKAGIFAELDEKLPGAFAIASNTSSIPIAQLAAATSRPERILGLHFFSPVPVMKLCEVVVALDTSPEVADRATEFIRSIEKKPIQTKDRSGFVVNMLLVPYLMAAVRMYEEGFASREDIDSGMKLGCGHPMGPLSLCDFIGLDVLYAVCDSLYEEFKRDEYAPPPLLKRMVAAGRHGRKSGRGFYEYS